MKGPRCVSWFSILALFVPCCLRASDRPNVLIIFTDDQRYDTIAALGNRAIRTPNLDRLATGGVVFSRAYIMGAMQGAVCVPSRAMLMSGRTLFRIRENLSGLTTWPEQFTRSGYRTFITGKWHNESESVLRSFGEGMAIFLGGMGNPFKLPVQDISADRLFINKRETSEHSVKVFADAAIEFLKKQDGKQPFLCYVAPNSPHDPRTAPQPYHDIYNADLPPLPANFLPLHPFNNGELTVRDELLAPWPRTPEVVRRHLADYYSSITFLDEQIGRILAALMERGLSDRTIVVFASDNGLAIGSHGLFGKQNLYEHSIHQPLIFSGPGIPRGKRDGTLSYLLDIFPTLGELCGVTPPSGSEGQSLSGVLRGGRLKGRDSIFSAYRDLQRAVRDERWKLIVYPKINKAQLFDLKNDPDETRDLGGMNKYPDIVRRLEARMKRWQKELGDNQALSTDKPMPLEFDYSAVKKK